MIVLFLALFLAGCAARSDPAPVSPPRAYNHPHGATDNVRKQIKQELDDARRKIHETVPR